MNTAQIETMRETMRQTDAIFALEGFVKTDLSRRIDEAILEGRITNGKAADEMTAYAAQHKSLDGFLDACEWLK